MRENHDTVSTLALALGVHYVTLTLKLNGKREFNKHEIEFISKRYNFDAEQTMKVPDPNPVQKNFHEVIEINDELTHAQAKKLVAKKHFKFTGNIGAYLDNHFANDQKKLHLFTWSKTRRILMNGPQNCELTLDATSYPDNYQDFELEIENTNPALIQTVLTKLEQEYDFERFGKKTAGTTGIPGIGTNALKKELQLNEAETDLKQTVIKNQPKIDQYEIDIKQLYLSRDNKTFIY